MTSARSDGATSSELVPSERRGAAQASTRQARKFGGPRWPSDHWLPYLLITPTAIVLIGVIGLPLLAVVTLSLTNARLISAAHFIGLRNYQNLLTANPEFVAAVLRTVVWSLGSIALEFFVGLVVALLLNRQLPARGLVRGLVILPWVIPPVAAALVWLTQYDVENGVFNYVLRALGLPPVHWLSDPHLVLASLIVVAVWKYSAFMIVGLLAALQTVPRELYEAASIDGAGGWQNLRHVILPTIWPVCTVLIVLGLIWRTGHFDLVALMTGGGPANNSQILSLFAYQDTISRLQAGEGAAAALIGVCGLVLLIPYIVRQFSQRWH